jgi:outer membrane protein
MEQTARVAFATALGLGADTDVSPVDDSSGLENTSPALKLPTYDAALAVANGERGDLQADRLLVASSQSSLRSAKLGLSPTVSLGATKDLDSTSIGGSDFRNDASLGVSISIPIYDQGITKANVASAKATLAENQANTQTTGLTVQSDVRDALITVVSDRSSLDEARAAYAAAQASLASTQGQYRVGVTNLPTLITAETTLASASTTLVTSIYTFQFAQANLRYEMGTNLES